MGLLVPLLERSQLLKLLCVLPAQLRPLGYTEVIGLLDDSVLLLNLAFQVITLFVGLVSLD